MSPIKNKPLVISVVIGAVLIILMVGLWLFFPGLNAGKSANQSAARIEMTADGFSQTAITINKGETVEWVNNDTDFRWPASNVHPSHEAYPEFDPKTPIAPGQAWSFTFDQAGEWKFHDHLKPYFVGTITVVE